MFKYIKDSIDKKKHRRVSRFKQLYTEDTGTEYDFYFKESNKEIKKKNKIPKHKGYD